jgi:serine/threonine protein kinase
MTISPEQICLNYEIDAKVDYQSDVWALGVIIYYMCTGLFPFSGYSKDGNHTSAEINVFKK